MSDKKSDINTVANYGDIGAIAIGQGATAINATGNVSFHSEAFNAQCDALEAVIKSERSEQLLEVFHEAKRLLDVNPKESKVSWEKLVSHGGSIASITSAILAMLAL